MFIHFLKHITGIVYVLKYSPQGDKVKRFFCKISLADFTVLISRLKTFVGFDEKSNTVTSYPIVQVLSVGSKKLVKLQLI